MKRKLVLPRRFVVLAFCIILAGCDKTPKTYTVTFEVGKGSGFAPSSQTVPEEKSNITLPNQGNMIAPPDTIFAGWYPSYNDLEYHSGGSSYRVRDDVTFFPYWRDYPDFLFYLNGGTLENAGIYSNDVISIPVIPTKEGYTFCGWYLDKELTNPFDKSTGLKGRIPLFAQWVPDSFMLPVIAMPDDWLPIIEFRLWGWSRNGKVAYSIEQERDGIMDGYVEYYIMDMITDEIVFQLRISPSNKNTAIEDLYYKEQEKILKSINDHNIETYQSDCLPFPIQKGDFEYYCFINEETAFQDTNLYGFGYRPIVKYDIIINRNGKNKTIKTVTNERSSTRIAGYFMSPFENRALVVTIEGYFLPEITSYGNISGYKVQYSYVFSGCHLGVGFE